LVKRFHVDLLFIVMYYHTRPVTESTKTYTASCIYQ